MRVEPHRFSQERYFSSEADRRKSKRLPIEREVRYKVSDGQKDLSGSGKTINLSGIQVDRGGSTKTYVRVAGTWTYLHMAVDSSGEAIDFMLSPK